MQNLFETVARILNDYSVHFDKSKYSLEFVAEDDVDDVLRLLERAVERPGSS